MGQHREPSAYRRRLISLLPPSILERRDALRTDSGLRIRGDPFVLKSGQRGLRPLVTRIWHRHSGFRRKLEHNAVGRLGIPPSAAYRQQTDHTLPTQLTKGAQNLTGIANQPTLSRGAPVGRNRPAAPKEAAPWQHLAVRSYARLLDRVMG